MNRRALLKLASLTAGAASAHPRLLASLSGPAPAASSVVKRVLIVFKCHLDVGFTQTQEQVMRKYFDVYYPAAIERASRFRTGGDRYIWTTGSWLLYEYLEQADAAEHRVMEQAIAAGDITWHALPFSWQTEMLDRSMIEGALRFSGALDARFGRKTIAAKMTDVPGHSRGIIAPLAGGGVQLLDIGVNAASTPPDVPDVFQWRDPAGHSIVMLYHRHDYGSVLQIPGSDLAVAVEVRGDNSGPHTPEEIAAIYARLRAQFPHATVKASEFNEVARAIAPYRHELPVVTQEIGDTWIYGIPSDPEKVARYREMARLRRTWIAKQSFAAGDATDRQLLRRLLLAIEHTWGTDTKSYLDNAHYRPADLAAVLDEPGYKTMRTSWQEKRDDIDQGIASLPGALRQEAGARLTAMRATTPVHDGMVQRETSEKIEGKHYTIALDPETGAITHLMRRATRHNWASPESPLALFTYQTLSSEDYAGFLDRYIKTKADWAPRDFGKPGIEKFGARSQEWHPRLVESWISRTLHGVRVLLHLRIADPAALASGTVAWPEEMYMELVLPDAEPVAELRLTTLGKRANRMPEAMWLSFVPRAVGPRGCMLSKVGEQVHVGDVVRGGGRAMHAVSDRVSFAHSAGGEPLQIVTLDAPVVALGQRSPLNFSLEAPGLAEGVHFSLYNNAWGTNYPQWCGGDWVYRFTLMA